MTLMSIYLDRFQSLDLFDRQIIRYEKFSMAPHAQKANVLDG